MVPVLAQGLGTPDLLYYTGCGCGSLADNGGGFNSGDFFSHQPEIKVLAVGVSSEARPWLAHGHLLIVSPHGLFSVPAHPWCFSWYPNVLF